MKSFDTRKQDVFRFYKNCFMEKRKKKKKKQKIMRETTNRSEQIECY